MVGIKYLHVIFDSSGSFCEPGKQHMLRYLVNGAMNLKFMSWARAEFIFHTWGMELCDFEDGEIIKSSGVVDVEVLRSFLLELGDDEAVILITDGNFRGADKKFLTDVTNSLSRRFAVVAAGYDAAITRLKSLSKNFFFAEDMCTAVKILAS